MRLMRPLRVLSLTLVMLLLPFAVVLAYATIDPVFSYAVNLYLFDLALAALVAATAPVLYRRARARILGLGAAFWLALCGILALAFAVHPSLEGAQFLWRAVGALAIAVAFSTSTRDERTLFLLALGAGTLFQAGWAIAQVVTGGPLSASYLFESQKPLLRSGEAYIAKGTMQTPYLLASLALVTGALAIGRTLRAARPLGWAALAAGALVPVGLTYSRAAAVVILGWIALLGRDTLRGARCHRLALAAILLGAGIPALLTADGWLARGQPDRLDSGRGSLLLQGIAVFASDPVFGVGPGRYMAEVRAFTDDPDVRARLLPTHNVPLLLAAEAGALAGATVLVLLGALGLRALRGGDAGRVLFLAYVPFWILDPMPYSLPQGVLLTGLWLGTLDAAHAGADG